MDKLYKMNYLSSLSFIIIGLLLYVTSYGHQSFSVQEREDNSDTNNNEESNGNDIFSDLSRNLPDNNEELKNEDGELLDSEGPIFDPDLDEFNDNNEIGNSENIVESNEQGTTSKSIEKSFNSEFSDSSKEAEDIINEDVEYSKSNIESSSSSNKLTNEDENNNNIIINNSD